MIKLKARVHLVCSNWYQATVKHEIFNEFDGLWWNSATTPEVAVARLRETLAEFYPQIELDTEWNEV